MSQESSILSSQIGDKAKHVFSARLLLIDDIENYRTDIALAAVHTSEQLYLRGLRTRQ